MNAYNQNAVNPNLCSILIAVDNNLSWILKHFSEGKYNVLNFEYAICVLCIIIAVNKILKMFDVSLIIMWYINKKSVWTEQQS